MPYCGEAAMAWFKLKFRLNHLNLSLHDTFWNLVQSTLALWRFNTKRCPVQHDKNKYWIFLTVRWVINASWFIWAHQRSSWVVEAHCMFDWPRWIKLLQLAVGIHAILIRPVACTSTFIALFKGNPARIKSAEKFVENVIPTKCTTLRRCV